MESGILVMRIRFGKDFMVHMADIRAFLIISTLLEELNMDWLPEEP